MRNYNNSISNFETYNKDKIDQIHKATPDCKFIDKNNQHYVKLKTIAKLLKIRIVHILV